MTYALADDDALRTGEAYDDEFGATLAIADLDVDGVGELVVGAPRVDDLATDAGAVYGFTGSSAERAPRRTRTSRGWASGRTGTTAGAWRPWETSTRTASRTCSSAPLPLFAGGEEIQRE
jgi:hypothetical protein